MTRATATLLRTWAVLIVLSVVSLPMGLAENGLPLGIAGAAILLAVMVLKGQQILTHYMELHRAQRGWRVGLTAYLVVVGAFILAAYAAAELGWVPIH